MPLDQAPDPAPPTDIAPCKRSGFDDCLPGLGLFRYYPAAAVEPATGRQARSVCHGRLQQELHRRNARLSIPRRTTRYYIQIGLIDRPEGVGRGAHYTTRHLEQLLEIRKWQQVGLSLERIRELLAVPAMSPDGPVLQATRKLRKESCTTSAHWQDFWTKLPLRSSDTALLSKLQH